jgi:ATP-binding cassette subfamily B protein
VRRRSPIVIFVFIIIDCGIVLSVPYLIGRSVDAISPVNGAVNLNLLTILTAALAFAYIGNSLINLLQGWLMAGIAQNIVKLMRSRLFEKLQKLPNGEDG